MAAIKTTTALPADDQAEKSVLAGMITNPITKNRALGILTVKDFFYITNRQVFQAIKELEERREPVDVTTIGEHLSRSNVNRNFKVSSLLSEFAGDSAAHITLVKQLSKRRQVLELFEASRPKLSGLDEVDDIISELTSSLIGITADKTRSPVTIGAATIQAMKKIEEASKGGEGGGIKTGITGFDQITGGGFLGEVIIIAARPGLGKTAMALTLAVNWAMTDVHSMLVNAEMPVWQLATRVLARESRIANFDLRRGKLVESDYADIVAAAGRIATLPIMLYDDNHWGRIKAQVRSEKIKNNKLSVVMFDYIQRIKVDAGQDKRYLDLGRISSESKDLARELDLLVIILSQVNRDLDKSKKAPELSDLRESGDMEADADVVSFLDPQKKKEKFTFGQVGSRVNWIIRKNRGGPDGMIPLRYNGDLVMFEDWREEPAHDEIN